MKEKKMNNKNNSIHKKKTASSTKENNIHQKIDNNSESTIQQEMIQEILNISKIKDGFFIGDRISAISIDVVNEFKITHIINTTGEQIENQWESLGINYLTINWSEKPNQILFDFKDEIADKILEFIDKALFIGEGILAHSFNGKNRVCVVSLIYLMKKYKWSLGKSMQYLKSKKNDVEISNFFYNQLENFQKRLILKGELTRDIPWEFENLIDDDEKLMRNTYINGLHPNPNNRDNENNNRIMDLLIGYNDKNNYEKNMKLKHIIWADNNPNSLQNCKIEILNLNNDLCLKKDIKPIIFHMQYKAIKPCIKNTKNKSSKIQFNINSKKNINIIKQKINFDNFDKNKYKNEYINKLENNNLDNQIYNKNIKRNKIFFNNIDKNISNNNTNSNTPDEEIKDNIDNKSLDKVKDKFIFNAGSLYSFNPTNIHTFEPNFKKETKTIFNNDREFQNQIRKIEINNSSINNKDNKNISIKRAKDNNIISNFIGNNKKIQNISNANGLTNSVNYLIQNLIGITNQTESGKDNYLSAHPLFNKNKNRQNAPVKIKTNNNYINIKKPGTPVGNQKFILNSFQNVATNYNSTKKLSPFINNFNSISSPISFNNNSNIKNQIKNNRNKSSSDRPSTAPHKNKNKEITGINFNSNLNPKNKSNAKSSSKSKIIQRPLNAENKIKNKNINKKEIKRNNVKKNKNTFKYNSSVKQRMPSLIIKPDDIFLNKKVNK